MGFFSKLFGKPTLTVLDSDFGHIKSLSIKNNVVIWKFQKEFLNTNISVYINGNKEGVDKKQKLILLNALENELQIKSESEKAIKEEFENIDMEFVSLEKHFSKIDIFVSSEGFELTFHQKEAPYYIFNVFFKNNKQLGVSIDS